MDAKLYALRELNWLRFFVFEPTSARCNWLLSHRFATLNDTGGLVLLTKRGHAFYQRLKRLGFYDGYSKDDRINSEYNPVVLIKA